MKISLYPTADGCFRPAEVIGRARFLLGQGKRVAICSGDPAFAALGGAVLVRRVGKAFDALHSIRPDAAVIDALDFTDPDAEELLSLQEMPGNPPVQVAGHRFRRMLGLLDEKAGTGEVMLVSRNDAISDAWKERLARWGVLVRWDLAETTRWRTWFVEGFDRMMPPDLFPAPQEGALDMKAEVHSPRSHLLLAMAAEYSDIFCKDARSMTAGSDAGFAAGTENPGRLLIRMMAGKPAAERIRHCRLLREDLGFLVSVADGYLQALEMTGKPGRAEDSGTAVTAARPAPAPVHPMHGRKLH